MASPRRTLVAAFAVLATAAVFSAQASAQGIASNADELQKDEVGKGSSRVAEIDEIERGLYLSIDYGPNYFIPIKGANFVVLNPDYVRPGTRMGVRAGYDILNNIQLDVFLLANFNEGVIDANAVTNQQLTGDVSHFAPGIGLRFDFVTSEDQRFFAFVRAGVGYAFWFPSALAQGAPGSVHTDASLGVEYYTKLRHLSVGVEGDVQALIAPFAFGIEVYPTLKYTF